MEQSGLEAVGKEKSETARRHSLVRLGLVA